MARSRQSSSTVRATLVARHEPVSADGDPVWLGRLGATRVTLAVIVQPQSSATGWSGIHDGQLRVRLAAPPVDGKANEELIRFVAQELKVPRRDITVHRGQTAKRKTLALFADAETVIAAIRAAGADVEV
jgi:uncharacterized protein (TIGR00251 family)